MLEVVSVIARLNDGGPARVLAELARHLPAHGVRMRILAGACDSEERDLLPSLAAEGLEIERVPHLGRSPRWGGDLLALLHLRARLAEARPHLVHTHTAKAGALGRMAAASLGQRTLHTYHGHVLSGYFSPTVETVVRTGERLLGRLGHLHALTPGQVRDLRDHHQVGRAGRWHCLPIPIAPVVPRPAPWHAGLRPGVPVVGFLGRMVPIKDPWLFIAVVQAISQVRPVQGLMCGDGPLLPAVRAAAAAAGILCPGQVPAAEALAAMDLLLMTSRNEGLPLSAVEAAGAGIPVVAPPVGGLADVAAWGGVAGAERTVEGLAAACLALLPDGPVRRHRIASGRRLAAALEPRRLAGSYASLYRRLVRAGRRTRP